MLKHFSFSVLAIALAAFILTGCCSTSKIQQTPPPGTQAVLTPIEDPLEGFNRSMQSTNKYLEIGLLHPVSQAYTTLVPGCIRTGIKDFGLNAKYPLRLVNNALQGEFDNCWDETKRFFINTTLGLGGLFDLATTRYHIPAHYKNFGSTFAHYGCGEGYFLNLPIAGPTNTRDAAGMVLDFPFNLITWVFPSDTPLVLNGIVLGSATTDNNEFYDHFFKSNYETYTLTKAYSTLGRRAELAGSTVREMPNPISPAFLGSNLLQPKDPDYIRNARTRSVRLNGASRKMPYTCWPVAEPKALTIIIPGLGSHRQDAALVTLAELLNGRGSEVITISSSMNFDFFLNTPEACPPGYVPQDIAYIAETLTLALKDWHARHPGSENIPVKLLGYSLGAYHTLFLADKQKREGVLPEVSSFIAINPPADASYALSRIDDYMNIPASWPEETREQRAEEVLTNVLAALTDASHKTPLMVNEEESQFLIGLVMRNVLAEVILASQARNNQGFLKNAPDDFKQNALCAEALSMTYTDYMEKAILPYYRTKLGKPDMSMDDIAAVSRISAITDSLRDNDKVRVLHNEDDFLVKREGFDMYKEVLKDRFMLFSVGGHLGNIAVPDYQKGLLKVLAL